MVTDLRFSNPFGLDPLDPANPNPLGPPANPSPYVVTTGPASPSFVGPAIPNELLLRTSNQLRQAARSSDDGGSDAPSGNVDPETGREDPEKTAKGGTPTGQTAEEQAAEREAAKQAQVAVTPGTPAARALEREAAKNAMVRLRLERQRMLEEDRQRRREMQEEARRKKMERDAQRREEADAAKARGAELREQNRARQAGREQQPIDPALYRQAAEIQAQDATQPQPQAGTPISDRFQRAERLARLYRLNRAKERFGADTVRLSDAFNPIRNALIEGQTDGLLPEEIDFAEEILLGGQAAQAPAPAPAPAPPATAPAPAAPAAPASISQQFPHTPQPVSDDAQMMLQDDEATHLLKMAQMAAAAGDLVEAGKHRAKAIQRLLAIKKAQQPANNEPEKYDRNDREPDELGISPSSRRATRAILR